MKRFLKLFINAFEFDLNSDGVISVQDIHSISFLDLMEAMNIDRNKKQSRRSLELSKHLSKPRLGILILSLTLDKIPKH